VCNENGLTDTRDIDRRIVALPRDIRDQGTDLAAALRAAADSNRACRTRLKASSTLAFTFIDSDLDNALRLAAAIPRFRPVSLYYIGNLDPSTD